MRLFCFGFGYCAEYLALRLASRDWSITGTSRTRTTPNRRALNDVYLHKFEGLTGLDDTGMEALLASDAVLISVPPEPASGLDPVLALHRNIFKDMPNLKWIGYLSSTGVYGDCNGEWVDETSPLQSTEPRAVARVKAENDWLNEWKAQKLPIHIFRPSGIYGPRRSPIERILHGHGQIISKLGHVFNRIHVADIAKVLETSILTPTPGEVYNLADDEPAPQEDVMHYAYRLLHREAPCATPFESAQLSPMARSFYMANKRVKNDKIKENLGVELGYPTYRSGLRAIYNGLQG